MPFEVSTVGMDDLLKKLESAGDKAEGIAARALYVGAGIVADGITKAAQSIKTEPFRYAAGGRKRLPSPEEKEALLSGGAAGIATFEKNGHEVNTIVGYSRKGYASVNFSHMASAARTNYKLDGGKATASSKARRIGSGGANGKPVAVIANAINSGTSFMEKQPFIRKGVNASKSAALAAIDGEITQMVNDLLKD